MRISPARVAEALWNRERRDAMDSLHHPRPRYLLTWSQIIGRLLERDMERELAKSRPDRFVEPRDNL
jgi:hypothetical protein